MTHYNLNGCWKLKTSGKTFNHGEIDAQVPGSVLDTWINAGLVSDPYYGENEKLITPLFENDFEYSRTFSLDREFLEKDRVDLVCCGIDTLGELFLNGHKLGPVNNMHRTWRFDVRDYLVPGENVIRIALFSPNAFIIDAYKKGPVDYINTGTMAGSNYLRKTHCQFGWDWGPMLPDAGIWRDIFLEGWNIARIEDVYITQEHSTDEQTAVNVLIKAEPMNLRRFWREDRILSALLRITSPSGEITEINKPLPDITAALEISCMIEKPRLWWPRGLGEQPLYDVEVELYESGSGIIDSWKRRIGLRTLTVSSENDQWGREFTFTVNGIKFFSMGADYIPEDAVFPRMNPRRTRRLLEQCVKANFNSIRVWGGGCYPNDYFYDTCDELGLVVWQDFMFACNIYELNDSFAANVTEEIRQNIKRIRHHACLALWCGNNEMEQAWMDWSEVRNHPPKLKADYIKLFEGLIPDVVKKNDPCAFYWPSSPSSSGSFDVPNDPNRGNVHFWEVWHSLKPFSEYRKHLFRFCSEFGFESLPDLETIQTFAKAEDLNLFSPVMEAHQRNPGGNGKILYYIAETYRYPKDFASLVYISQVLQMESIQSGVDHWRRHRGRCMGAIYWQLNDCWPVTSWSSIDYYGRWKALHYGARRFFAPVRATVFIDETEKQTARVFIHNDTMNAASGTLSLSLKDRDFNTLAEETIDVTLEPLSASEAFARDYSGLIYTTELERSCFVTAELKLHGKGETAIVSQETALFVPPKYFSFKRPEYKITVSDRGSYFAIALTADTFCRFVRLKISGEDPVFSDNYFDITGSEATEIMVSKDELKKPYSVQSLREALDTIVSVNDS